MVIMYKTYSTKNYKLYAAIVLVHFVTSYSSMFNQVVAEGSCAGSILIPAACLIA